MEVNIYFAREMDIKGKTHKVLQRKNMGSLVELRYRKMLNAKMMYTENGEIIIRIKRKGKVIYSLLKNINDAVRQQNHIIDKYKKAKPRITNSEHRLEVLNAEKELMNKCIGTAFKIFLIIKEKTKESSPNFERIKDLISWLDLMIAGLWVKPYLTTAKKINIFTPNAFIAAENKDTINLKKNLKIIEIHFQSFKE